MYPNDFARVGLPSELRQLNRPPVQPLNLTASELRVASAPSTEEISLPLPKIEIRESPGRGLGVFAVEAIPAFTRIIEDHALLSLAENEDVPEIWEKYKLLPPDLKQEYDGLSSTTAQHTSQLNSLASKLQRRGYAKNEAKQIAGVGLRFQLNAFKTASLEDAAQRNKWARTLFATVARLNHSCTPNAHCHYRPSSGAQLAYSIRDIEAGEEIEISYLNITLPQAERQAKAQNWGFKCTCPACAGLIDGGRKKYEDVLTYVNQTGAFAIGGDPRSMHQQSAWLRKAIDLASSPFYPWLVPALPELYQTQSSMLVVGAMLFNEDSEAARLGSTHALEQAVQWQIKLTGAGSPPTIEARNALNSHMSGKSVLDYEPPASAPMMGMPRMRNK